MTRMPINGRSRALTLLQTSTALVSISLAVQAFPAFGQTVIPAGTYSDARTSSVPADQPKAANGPDSCNNQVSVCVGDDSQTGSAGAQGNQAGDINLAYAPGVFLNGRAGTITNVILTNGGRGGDGGDGGALQGGVGYSNGGKAGDGGSAGANTLEQRADASPGSAAINGTDQSAMLMQANGGDGGDGGSNYSYGAGGQGGVGGSGGKVSFTQDSNATITSIEPNATAVRLESRGGNGGNSPDARTHTSHATANNGGLGGTGGAINATLSGSIVSQGSGVVGISAGGNGGNGGFAQSDSAGATGGQGGFGAGSSDVTLTLNGGSITSVGASGPATGAPQTAQGGTITFSVPTAALMAITQGGIGGTGNGTGTGFGKGVGGDGGDAGGNADTFVNNRAGTVSTSGYAASGLVAQSIGGHGGNGGYGGGVFVSKGGNGATGGNGGDTIAQTNGGRISTSGDSSAAMVAQSLGGGGGFGASASVSAAVVGVTLGGSGADGGNGGLATILNGTPNEDFSQFTDGSVVSTGGYGAHAMIAQSIGGGGGEAGDATTTVVGGILSVAIGGSAGTGGSGGAVNVQNGGVVQTGGDDAYGMIGQSVGGGGGDGGAAYSLDIGAQLTVSTAVGGNGGAGGVGNSVSAGNQGQIVTSGGNSYGIVAQSVGGGGGTGGSSFARTIQVYNDPEYPSLTLNVSLGGHGGTGGIGGNVAVGNQGAILTDGAGAYGVLAQSIGGGGGAGGDADSLNQAYNASTFTVTTTIGGRGGQGGNGGTVSVENSGFINTAGDGATAVYAQSVGGGGGTGGSGSADTGSYNESEKAYSFQFTLALGGAGGNAGNGGAVTVQNDATGIATYGLGSQGVFAQSVGGGGGDAGNATAKGGGGSNNFNIGVGGTGGGGGIGGTVTVTNNAAILTTGGDSAAVYAQSIGGGGGIGGSGTVGDGSSPQVTLAEYIAKGMGIGEDVIDLGNNIYELEQKGQDQWDDISKLKGMATNYENSNGAIKTPEGEEGEGSVINVNIGGGIGGHGGTAGTGGNLAVTNTGSIETDGAASEGIFAQSVGGGGGDGGAATSANGKATLNGSFGIGGNSGSAGNGGTIGVTNSGKITTFGDLSHAIFAQSVGGGGGQGGMSAGDAAAYTLVTVNMGGNGGSNGDGGTVSVSNTALIETNGDDAIGIVAQSMGGGGGVAGVMTQNETTGESETGNVSDQTLIPITLSGSAGTGNDAVGKGQKVEVGLSGGNITTHGRDSYGVLAQSIGGGGGLVLGVNGEANQAFFGTNTTAGAGGEIDITLSSNVQISTEGAGAVGILAQSIGGGGGLVGGMSAVDLSAGTKLTPAVINHAGEGGNINIDVQAGSRIDTFGTRAHGIFAQAVGSGGGLFGIQGGEGYAMAGRFACVSATCPGTVTINADGFVRAHGPDSWGIYALAQGNGNSGVTINLLGGTGIVTGSNGGIYIDSQFGTNVINNNGYISGANGVAIATNGKGTLISGRPSGGIVNIIGNILSSGGGWNITNNVTSRLYTNTLIQSSGFTNLGEIWLGSLSANNVTEIAGGLYSPGRIVIGVDFAAGKADLLKIDGEANIGGHVLVNPINLQKGTATFITAGSTNGSIPQDAFNFIHNKDDTLTPVGPYLYHYEINQVGNEIQISADTDFLSVAGPAPGTFKKNHLSVARHLQEIWDGGSAAGNPRLLSNVLSRVNNSDDYVTALESLGAHTIGVAATSRATGDRAFTNALLNCPSYDPASLALVERSCYWSRAGGGIVDTQTDTISRGFDADVYALQVGGQKEIHDGWFLGGSLGFENSNVRSDTGLATTKGDSIFGGVSVKHQSGGLIVSGAVSGGAGWFQSRRTIVIADDISTATARPRTKTFGGHLKASYDIVGKSIYLRPQLNLDATYVHMHSFTEGGSRYALAVSSSRNWMFSANPAIELGAKVQSGAVTGRPWIRAGVAFYDDRDWKMNAQIADTTDALAGFVADTSMPETVATLGAGLDVVSAEGLSLRIEYSGEVSKSYNAHAGFLRLGYHF